MQAAEPGQQHGLAAAPAGRAAEQGRARAGWGGARSAASAFPLPNPLSNPGKDPLQPPCPIQAKIH